MHIQLCSEQFTSDAVMVTLEWTLLNSQDYYQQLLSNVSVSADPQLNNVVPTGNTSIQLELSYNILYNLSVTQNSVCKQLMRTTILLLNYSKLLDCTLYASKFNKISLIPLQASVVTQWN